MKLAAREGNCAMIRNQPAWRNRLLSLIQSLAWLPLALSAPGNIALADKPKEIWPIPDWQVVSPESQQMSAARLERVRQWHVENSSKTGLVIRHGRIVAEWYFGDAKASTQLLVFSVTKSVSSTAVGLAMAKGNLSVDTPVGKYLSHLEPPQKTQITLGQLLSMTSGVHNNKKLDQVADQFHYAMFEAPQDFPPGEKWDYNNTGLALLSPFFQAATRQPLDQFVGNRIFKPIGIRTADWSWDANGGFPLPFSGLHINARALARFGLLVLRKGRWKEKQIVPADWLTQAVQPSQQLEKKYSYLWWNNSQGQWRHVPKDAFAAVGKFENDMLIVPSLDLIVVRQVGDETGHEHKTRADWLFRLAVEACDQSIPSAPPTTEDSGDDS